MPVEGPLGAGVESRGRAVARGTERTGGLRPTSRMALCASISGAALLAGAATSFAQDALGGRRLAGGLSMGAIEVIQLAIFAGIIGSALVSAVWLIRERARISADNLDLRARAVDQQAALQRAEALLNLKDQRVVVWQKGVARPELAGMLAADSGAPEDRAAFLAFGRWLAPRSAAALEAATLALREKSRPFDLVVETHAGLHLEAQGRVAAQHSVLRFSALSEARKAHARLRFDHQKLEAEYMVIRGLIDAIPAPFWVRGADQALLWVNKAYAAAVEAASPELATREGHELMGTQARETIARQHDTATIFSQTLSTVIGGDRRLFLVTDVAGAEGSAGIAIDRSEEEHLLAEQKRTLDSHAGTLDLLATAVAIFDSGEKLRFFNQAFQKLWDLDTAFLESAPDHGLVLDRLRSDGKIAEQPEWRRWKETVLSAYRSVESQDHSWHLPDGRTIRVLANPHPNGGVTWIFENLTERIDLESRYKTAVRVQSETLDNLAEGVTVFGPDGRLRLANPAFSALWGIDPALARAGVHISTLRAACEAVLENGPWGDFVAAVTGFDEERVNQSGQVALANGTALRHALIHLPNGQVMLTFVDVTDSVNVERALKDKNEALQNADQLKNDFVQHVSYELRSPLTNIMGFTELLDMPETGPLTPRQKEYVGHIGSSSAVLLAIVNDILDLATMDAGIMRLDIGEVRIADAVAAAAERVAERLRDHRITLSVDIARDIETFLADESRIRQVLAHLLSNAANYAPEGSVIALACRRANDRIAFSVHDDGPGMPPEVLDMVYRRFESRSNGGRKRGAGLGLSIVKSFVELHGGEVAIETGQGRGTTVTCTFPSAPDGMMEAAE